MQVKTSPIRYMGNKRKLIKKGLCDLFPTKIRTFYDLFGGSGIVGMNVKANKHVLNEVNTNVFELYQMFKTTDPNKIIQHTVERIKEYDLPTINTDKRAVGEEVREFYKGNYMHFRKSYNSTPSPLDLYVLMNYAMSQTMRFNKKGEFNMPFGNNRFIMEKHGQEIKDFHTHLQHTDIHNKDYRKVEIDISKDSFVYLDPPYLGSGATYNENGAWGKNDNRELLKYLKKLDDKGVRWGVFQYS